MAKSTRKQAVTRHGVVIVGTGFAGLGMAIRMKQAGMEDFVILEKASDVGGTWRDNQYPGCACDVQSHLYSFSFEPNPEWSRMFSPQPEIWDYLRACARRYGLQDHIRFNTELAEARWDEKAALWQLQSSDGRKFAARVLISGMGALSRPAYPSGIQGLETFAGKAFHSQQWDHGFDFSGKRVAVIGTGASAIQFVPQIQKQVAHLDLYQRTPPWIMPKPDRAISDFEHALFRRVPLAQKAYRTAIYWMLESRVLGFTINPRLMKLVEREARRHIRHQVADPALRAKLTPDYTIGCKRVLISDDYYPALAQSNVDVLTSGIREVRPHSIVGNDGVEREVDAIIYGTGFHAADAFPAGMIFGREGRDIVDAWREGAEAYKGTTVAGFPNLFMIVGPNTGLGHSSMVFMIESQVAYVVEALKKMSNEGVSAIEVRPEAQTGFNQGLQAKLRHAVWTAGGCKSWYLAPNGKNVTLWPGFTFAFRRQLSHFDSESYVMRAQGKGGTAGDHPGVAVARAA